MEKFYEFVGNAGNVSKGKALGKTKPVPLSKLPDQLATVAATSGDQKYDKMPATPIKYPVGQLKPAQTELIPEKALGFALGFLEMKTPDLNNMEAIISNDTPNPYIMDGHHRWAAATLVDPNMQVGVYKINMPAGPLITALNIYTKGVLKKPGNPGKGDITQWKQLIPAAIDAAVQNGLYYWPLGSQESYNYKKAKIVGSSQKVQEILTKFGGGNLQAGIQKMKDNAQKLFTEKFPDAPERIDMPVIEGTVELKQVCDAIASGRLDLVPPFNPEVKKLLPELDKHVSENYMFRFSDFRKRHF